jgi:hypothetical protein
MRPVTWIRGDFGGKFVTEQCQPRWSCSGLSLKKVDTAEARLSKYDCTSEP